MKIRIIEFRNAQEKAVEKLAEQFSTGEIKKVSTLVRKQNELLDTSSDFAQVRKVWKLTIVNEKLIPAKYLIPDDVAIKAAFKAGLKVPGCKWEQETNIAI